MAGLVLDTGALIAIERSDRRVGAVLFEAARDGLNAVTSSACVAEAWRDPARQGVRFVADMIDSGVCHQAIFLDPAGRAEPAPSVRADP